MDANRVLGPGETILVMRQGQSGGKTVSGTRVFHSWHDFQEYAIKNLVTDAYNKPVGTVIGSSPMSAGRVLTITKQGYQLRYSRITAYIASDRDDPKRFTIKVSDFGLPEGKYEWVKPKP